ncbi:hypothetical protein [Microcoleus sp. POL10_C6]|uniref:hypothetical protein n=1 Tax=Microcoleus sp. POL10_C6 TaxID=2818852 RepID=UPI002FCEA0CB
MKTKVPLVKASPGGTDFYSIPLSKVTNMSIQSFTTLSQTGQQLVIDSETVETLVPAKASDRILLEAIGKLINLDEIVDRLQALDHQQCSLFTADQVKFAFLKWIENHLESIELQPEWFLNKDFKHFDRHLPFDDLQDAIELREYDPESIYEEIGVAHEAGLFDSPLEDDFEGTPQEAAINALSW